MEDLIIVERGMLVKAFAAGMVLGGIVVWAMAPLLTAMVLNGGQLLGVACARAWRKLRRAEGKSEEQLVYRASAEEVATGKYRDARGVVEWQEGDVLPEDAIRKMRGE